MMQRRYRKPGSAPIIQREYFWLIGLEDGILAISGPEASDAAATQLGLERFPSGEFEVVKLPTINDARASRLIKRKRLENENLNSALQRIRHKKPDV